MAHRDFVSAAGHSHLATIPSSRPEPSVARRSGGTSLVVASARKVPRLRRQWRCNSAESGGSARDDGIFVHMRIPWGERRPRLFHQMPGKRVLIELTKELASIVSARGRFPCSGNLKSLIGCSRFPVNFSGFPVSIPCSVVARTAEEVGQSLELVGRSASQYPVVQPGDSLLFRSPACPVEHARRDPPGRKPRRPTAKPVGPTAKERFCVRGSTH